QVVHRADDDLAVLHNGAVLGGVNAQDRGLRRINDGCGQHGAEHAAVGDGEGTACQLFQTELAVTRTRAEVGNRFLDVGDGHLVGVAQNGHHQTTRAANGNADVKVAVIDDVLAVHGRIDDGVLLQRSDSGLHEEGHEEQLDAVQIHHVEPVTRPEHH